MIIKSLIKKKLFRDFKNLFKDFKKLFKDLKNFLTVFMTQRVANLNGYCLNSFILSISILLFIKVQHLEFSTWFKRDNFFLF